MATHKSAIKRMRQNKTRMLRNRHVKSTMKTHIKDFLLSLDQKNCDDSNAKLKEAIKHIDKAASKGVIHKRNASRKISRLTRKLNSLEAS